MSITAVSVDERSNFCMSMPFFQSVYEVNEGVPEPNEAGRKPALSLLLAVCSSTSCSDCSCCGTLAARLGSGRAATKAVDFGTRICTHNRAMAICLWIMCSACLAPAYCMNALGN